MQKLKKKFALLLGIFLFSSCGSLPTKPKIEICSHSQSSYSAECYDNQTQEYRSIPMIDTDRYIMFSPDDYGLILLYIRQLEKKLRNSRNKSSAEYNISVELKKIIVTSELLN